MSPTWMHTRRRSHVSSLSFHRQQTRAAVCGLCSPEKQSGGGGRRQDSGARAPWEAGTWHLLYLEQVRCFLGEGTFLSFPTQEDARQSFNFHSPEWIMTSWVCSCRNAAGHPENKTPAPQPSQPCIPVLNPDPKAGRMAASAAGWLQTLHGCRQKRKRVLLHQQTIHANDAPTFHTDPFHTHGKRFLTGPLCTTSAGSFSVAFPHQPHVGPLRGGEKPQVTV